MEEGRLWQCDREELLVAAAELCGVGDRESIRTADLLLARSLAGHLGLLKPDVSVSRLEEELAAVALFAPPPISAKGRARAVAAAAACASRMADADLFHVWSESSQAGDPGRKGRGAFSTPPPLATVMARAALKVFGSAERIPSTLDPSAGHGALLLPLLAKLLAAGVEAEVAVGSLHGVELDPHARELCCLMIWLKAADPGIELRSIASRIVSGNALTALWEAESPQARISGNPSGEDGPFVWEQTFSRPFEAGGFDLVLSNPPWESLRGLHSVDAKDWSERELTRGRLGAEVTTGRDLPPLFTAQGGGDRNLYKAFVELFPHLLAPGGHLVALLPGAFSSDFGMKDARAYYMNHMAIDRWTGFENLAGYFPIDSRYKFGLLTARRDARGTSRLRVKFMAREADEALARGVHLSLSRTQIAELGGPTGILPEIADAGELEILERAFRHGSPFFKSATFGPIEYRRELDLTLDRRAGRFAHLAEARADGFTPRNDGTWSNGSQVLVPLIEGRMVSSWDFYEKSWISGNGRTARWDANGGSLRRCQPQFLAAPLELGEVRLAICDVTSATNTRTMRATWVPAWPCGNTAPVLAVDGGLNGLALLAVLNSMVFDWLLRRVAAGLHLNRFYLAAMRLPELGEAERRELARFAARTMLAGRCQGLAAPEVERLTELVGGRRQPSPARVEMITAQGYGLDATDMRRVLDAGTADRKGLWRYFAAVPEAERIAEESVRMLEAA